MRQKKIFLRRLNLSDGNILELLSPFFRTVLPSAKLSTKMFEKSVGVFCFNRKLQSISQPFLSMECTDCTNM